jgi:hypothetical protein
MPPNCNPVQNRWWVNFDYETNKKLPAQKADGRYKRNPCRHDTVL